MIVLIYVKWWYPVNSYADATVDPMVIDPLLGPQPNIATSPSIITLLIGDVMGLTGFAQKNVELYLWHET